MFVVVGERILVLFIVSVFFNIQLASSSGGASPFNPKMQVTSKCRAAASFNQASHTMSANARLFHNDPMEINLNRLGTSTEAAIVWI